MMTALQAALPGPWLSRCSAGGRLHQRTRTPCIHTSRGVRFRLISGIGPQVRVTTVYDYRACGPETLLTCGVNAWGWCHALMHVPQHTAVKERIKGRINL